MSHGCWQRMTAGSCSWRHQVLCQRYHPVLVPLGQITPLTAHVGVLSQHEMVSLLLFFLSSLPSKVCIDLSLCFPFTRLL